jgi:hypothetical protein
LAALFGPNSLSSEELIYLILFIGIIDLGFTIDSEKTGESSGQQKAAKFCEGIMTSLGWSELERRRRAGVELNNGRAAQMGILALMVHEKLNNDPYVLNYLLGFPILFNQ